MKRLVAFAIAASAVLAGCSEDKSITGPLSPSASALTERRDGVDDNSAGAVYTLTNQASGNGVAVFDRAADGTLSYATTVATGGNGLGASLGSQGALAQSEDGQFLFAVNAGTNDISTLQVKHGGVELVSRWASGGTRPISLTVHGNLLYVLNAAGDANITGFVIGAHGRLWPLALSTRPLDASAAPAEVSFSPDGRWLAVTEKNTSIIDLYRVGPMGRPGTRMTHASAGATPYGFAFGTSDILFVSEASGSASSYDVDRFAFHVVSAAVNTHQGAPCWLVVTGNNGFAYTANAASGTISGFTIGHDGSLTLLDASGATATPGPGNIDLALDGKSRFLYQLKGSGSITGYQVGHDGHLTLVNVVGGLPAGLAGLVAD